MLRAAAGLNIPKCDWGFHSAARAIPFDKPLVQLRSSDLPFRLCWHERIESYFQRDELMSHELARLLF